MDALERNATDCQPREVTSTDAGTTAAATGTVHELWRYPVKSMQGVRHDTIVALADGVLGDRVAALLDTSTGKVLSAKRHAALLLAAAVEEVDGDVTDLVIRLPDGTSTATSDPAVDELLSAWIGRPVHLARTTPGERRNYEMTFDPPNDDAEVVDIPTPPGSFVDWAPVHLLAAATLEACARDHPDLDWDVRRFRPNIVVDVDIPAFGEDAWCGGTVRVGGAVLRARQPTVRCAMPLRAQPGLARQSGLYAVLEAEHANHLGIYLDVEVPGTVTVGDPVAVTPPS